MGLDNWWNEAASKAEDFLGSGRHNETVLNAPLNYNTGSRVSRLAGGGGLFGGCTGSSQCPAGYACINGVCNYMDVGGGATGGSAASAGDCDGNDPLSPCNQSSPNSCQQTPNCGNDPQPRECCGARCCRSSGAGVSCFCGDCPPLPGCSDYCTNYRAANGEDADNCGGKSCDECSECNNRECVPLGSGAPCHCGQDSPCPGDCMKCVTDPESSSLGLCTLSPDDCMDCATIYDYQCPCNVILPSVTACKPWGADGLTSSNLAYAKAASMCSNGPCKDPDPCAPQCENQTYCTDTGTGATSCPAGWSQTGTLEAGGERCVFCQKCSTDNLPESCKDCDCNCHNDCKDCEICNAQGVCVPDPQCLEEYISTWSVVVPKYIVCQGAGGESCNAGTCTEIPETTYELATTACGPAPHTLREVVDCSYTMGFSTNDNGCLVRSTNPDDGFSSQIAHYEVVDGNGAVIASFNGADPVGWSGGAHPTTFEPGCTYPFMSDFSDC